MSEDFFPLAIVSLLVIIFAIVTINIIYPDIINDEYDRFCQYKGFSRSVSGPFLGELTCELDVMYRGEKIDTTWRHLKIESYIDYKKDVLGQ